jgi:hypothetical protein
LKAYVMTTGGVFGLLTLVHIGRMIAEGGSVAANPWYILVTAVAAALCVWAGRLLWIAKRG